MQGVWKGGHAQWPEETHRGKPFGGSLYPLQLLWKDIQVKKITSRAQSKIPQINIGLDKFSCRVRENLRKHKASCHKNFVVWKIYEETNININIDSQYIDAFKIIRRCIDIKILTVFQYRIRYFFNTNIFSLPKPILFFQWQIFSFSLIFYLVLSFSFLSLSIVLSFLSFSLFLSLFSLFFSFFLLFFLFLNFLSPCHLWYPW